MTIATSTFSGFSPDAIDFLAELAENNDRAWFQPRKADYERLLKEPMEQLCSALGKLFPASGIPLAADPVKSPFRIYRDVANDNLAVDAMLIGVMIAFTRA